MLQDTSPTTTIEWKNDGKRLIWIDLIVAKRDLTADGTKIVWGFIVQSGNWEKNPVYCYYFTTYNNTISNSSHLPSPNS